MDSRFDSITLLILDIGADLKPLEKLPGSTEKIRVQGDIGGRKVVAVEPKGFVEKMLPSCLNSPGDESVMRVSEFVNEYLPQIEVLAQEVQTLCKDVQKLEAINSEDFTIFGNALDSLTTTLWRCQKHFDPQTLAMCPSLVETGEVEG